MSQKRFSVDEIYFGSTNKGGFLMAGNSLGRIIPSTVTEDYIINLSVNQNYGVLVTDSNGSVKLNNNDLRNNGASSVLIGNNEQISGKNNLFIGNTNFVLTRNIDNILLGNSLYMTSSNAINNNIVLGSNITSDESFISVICLGSNIENHAINLNTKLICNNVTLSNSLSEDLDENIFITNNINIANGLSQNIVICTTSSSTNRPTLNLQEKGIHIGSLQESSLVNNSTKSIAIGYATKTNANNNVAIGYGTTTSTNSDGTFFNLFRKNQGTEIMAINDDTNEISTPNWKFSLISPLTFYNPINVQNMQTDEYRYIKAGGSSGVNGYLIFLAITFDTISSPGYFSMEFSIPGITTNVIYATGALSTNRSKGIYITQANNANRISLSSYVFDLLVGPTNNNHKASGVIYVDALSS